MSGQRILLEISLSDHREKKVEIALHNAENSENTGS